MQYDEFTEDELFSFFIANHSNVHPLDRRRFIAYAIKANENQSGLSSREGEFRRRGLTEEEIRYWYDVYNWVTETADYLHD